MSKPIKVEDRTYKDLDALRGPGETFSQVIDGLLVARLRILETITQIQRALKYDQWREDQLRKITDSAATISPAPPADK